MCSDRQFYVREGQHESEWHRQAFGIVHGCPLSPFLFSIAMTCLLQDASAQVEEQFGAPVAPGHVSRDFALCRRHTYRGG